MQTYGRSYVLLRRAFGLGPRAQSSLEDLIVHLADRLALVTALGCLGYEVSHSDLVKMRRALGTLQRAFVHRDVRAQTVRASITHAKILVGNQDSYLENLLTQPPHFFA